MQIHFPGDTIENPKRFLVIVEKNRLVKEM